MLSGGDCHCLERDIGAPQWCIRAINGGAPRRVKRLRDHQVCWRGRINVGFNRMRGEADVRHRCVYRVGSSGAFGQNRSEKNCLSRVKRVLRHGTESRCVFLELAVAALR